MKHLWRKMQKSIAVIVTMCLVVTMMPGLTIVAANASVSVTPSVSVTEMYPNQTATVKLQVTGKEGTITSTSVDKIIPTDIVLVIDQSGSMSGTNMGALKPAAVNFLNKIDFSKHRVGIVGYSDKIATKQDFTMDKNELINTVNGIQATGGTRIVQAVNEAVSMISQSKRADAKQVVIVLTDGQASDKEQAPAAAKAAKEQGIIFYTIGMYGKASNATVPGTSEYTINKTLGDLATSAEHHHFIGVDKLDETLKVTYEKIASTIGTDKAKNVVITQTLPEEFELVEGSTDANVPRPTISGKTITWQMQEVLNGTFNLSYQIKPKDGIAYGTYPNLESGTFTYELSDGTKKSGQIASSMITIKEPKKIEISDMTPKTGLVGEATTVTVKGKNMEYGNGFQIEVGGKKVPLVFHCNTYFTFKVPTDLPAGSYDVVITNAGGIKTNAGQYEYTVKPVPTMPPMDFTPKSGIVNKEYTIAVNANDQKLNVKKENLKIEVGDKIIPATFVANKYFNFKMPATLTVGTYDVTITNQATGESQKIGQYICNPAPTPTPLALEFTPKSGKVNEATVVNVRDASGQKLNMKRKDIQVKLSNTSNVTEMKTVSADFATNQYFRFKAPTGLSAGIYDVTLIYKGVDQGVIGQYSYNPIPTPAPLVLDFAPKSGKVNETTSVKVSSSNGQKLNMKKADIQVKLSNVMDSTETKTVSANFAANQYFTFKVPTGLSAGTYDVTVIHKGVELKPSIGQYTYNAVVVPTMPPIKLSPSSGPVGKQTTVTVKTQSDGQKLNVKKENLQITIDGTITVLTGFCCNTYFTFKTPATLTKGNHVVVIKNMQTGQFFNLDYKCE